MTDEQTAITVQAQPANNWLAPVTGIQEMLRTYQMFQEFIKAVLHQGTDFGTIPGTKKDTLYKPGAEKLNRFFGLRNAPFVTIDKVEDWTGAEHGGEPFFHYRVRCDLVRNGEIIASAEGACNSWEKKYRWRNAQSVCPECGKPAIFTDKKNGSFYCWRKKDGCGATFAANDVRITNQPAGQIPNPDIYDTVNTILKMAQKRAYVAVTLLATNSSDYFTQDLEDFAPSSYTEGEYRDAAPVEPPHTFNELPAPKATVGASFNPVYWLVDEKLADNAHSAAAMVNLCTPWIKRQYSPEQFQQWARLYRGWRDAGVDSKPAAENATAGEAAPVE